MIRLSFLSRDGRSLQYQHLVTVRGKAINFLFSMAQKSSGQAALHFVVSLQQDKLRINFTREEVERLVRERLVIAAIKMITGTTWV